MLRSRFDVYVGLFVDCFQIFEDGDRAVGVLVFGGVVCYVYVFFLLVSLVGCWFIVDIWCYSDTNEGWVMSY